MTTAFRALVMLAFFVGLPAAWIYYGPLPDGAQRVVDQFVAAAKEAVGWEKAIAARDRVAPVIQPTPLAPAWPQSTAAGQMTSESAPSFAPAQPSIAAAPTAQATLAAAVEPLLARLRAWGVAKYALEPWGAGNSLYRFHCEMPLAADAALTQQFEAVADDPQATIEQVVAEVATWQLARQEHGLIR